MTKQICLAKFFIPKEQVLTLAIELTMRMIEHHSITTLLKMLEQTASNSLIRILTYRSKKIQACSVGPYQVSEEIASPSSREIDRRKASKPNISRSSNTLQKTKRKAKQLFKWVKIVKQICGV